MALPSWEETQPLPSWEETSAVSGSLPSWEETEQASPIQQFVEKRRQQGEEGKQRLRAVGEGAASGLTLGFLDELRGVTGAGLEKVLGGSEEDFGELYKTYRDLAREREQGIQEENPYAYGGSRLAGMVAPALATGGAGTIPAMAARGAGIGATIGAGEAEEIEDIPEDLITGAALGAAGAPVGAAVGKGVSLAGKGIEKVGQYTLPPGKSFTPQQAFKEAMKERSQLLGFARMTGQERTPPVERVLKVLMRSGTPELTGAGVGFALGGPLGMATGYGVGKVLPAAARGIQRPASQVLVASGRKLGKYGHIIKQAAEKGPHSVAATHFVLSQQDPDYRKKTENIFDKAYKTGGGF